MCVCLAGQLVTASPSAVPHKHQNQSKSNPRTVPSSPRRVMQKVTAPSSPSAAALSPASMASRVSFLRVFFKKSDGSISRMSEGRQARTVGRSIGGSIQWGGVGAAATPPPTHRNATTNRTHAEPTYLIPAGETGEHALEHGVAGVHVLGA